VIALLLSGALAEGLGWEWVFYFFGILGTTWCLAWIFICHDSPEKHPGISMVDLRPIYTDSDFDSVGSYFCAVSDAAVASGTVKITVLVNRPLRTVYNN
jgi:MFS family permease